MSQLSILVVRKFIFSSEQLNFHIILQFDEGKLARSTLSFMFGPFSWANWSSGQSWVSIIDPTPLSVCTFYLVRSERRRLSDQNK